MRKKMIPPVISGWNKWTDKEIIELLKHSKEIFDYAERDFEWVHDEAKRRKLDIEDIV